MSYFNDLIDTIVFIYWDIYYFIQDEFIPEIIPLLTDPNNYGTIEGQDLYLLAGSGGAIAFALLMIPLAVRQQEKKWVKRRRAWVKF